MNKFETLMNEYQEKLELYVPVVARVHGDHHPEFHDVKAQYDSLVAKLADQKEISNEFESIRKITNNYVIPNDTCETYAAVYTMLSELDKAY